MLGLLILNTIANLIHRFYNRQSDRLIMKHEIAEYILSFILEILEHAFFI